MLQVVVLWILSCGIKLGVIVLCLLPLRWILRKKAPRVFSYMLWGALPVNVVCRLRGLLEPHVSALMEPILNKKSTVAIGVKELQIGVMVYMIGTVIVLGIMLFSYIRLQRCLVGSICLRENIYLTDRIKAPFSMGLLKPRVYLPYSLAEECYSPVILHEQVHIARKDLWVKHVAVVFLGMFWFQPMLWFAYILFINDMEAACDETVLRESKADFREEYAKALVEVSYQAGKIQGAAIGYGNGEIFERVQNVMRYQRPKKKARLFSMVACIVFVVISLLISERIPRIVQMEQNKSVEVNGLSVKSLGAEREEAYTKE